MNSFEHNGTRNERKKYEHELLPVQQRVHIVANELITQFRTESNWSPVDVGSKVKSEEALNILQELGLARLLRDPKEDLGLPDDWAYEKPITKAEKKLTGFPGISIFEHRYPKVRHSAQPDADGQHKTVRYEGEEDRLYEIELSFLYWDETRMYFDDMVVETITLESRSSVAELPQMSSKIWVGDYAETGYEGHDWRQVAVTSEDIENYLELIVRLIGGQEGSDSA